MTITKYDMDMMLRLTYWWNRKRFIKAWIMVTNDQRMAEHLFDKFISHD